MPPPERQLPLPEMSAAQLARYRRALVHYLRRRREEQPQYQVPGLSARALRPGRDGTGRWRRG